GHPLDTLRAEAHLLDVDAGCQVFGHLYAPCAWRLRKIELLSNEAVPTKINLATAAGSAHVSSRKGFPPQHRLTGATHPGILDRKVPKRIDGGAIDRFGIRWCVGPEDSYPDSDRQDQIGPSTRLRIQQQHELAVF